MHSRKIADTDFFLALMKESDWLKKKAVKIYRKYKGNIWISPFSVLEIMIICKREDIPLKETIIQISRISNLLFSDWDLFMKAVNYIEKGVGIFDAFLMALTNEDMQIISSDKVYGKFGFDIIDLKK